MQIYSNIFSPYTLIFSSPTRPTILQMGVFCRTEMYETEKCKESLFPTSSYNPTPVPTNIPNAEKHHKILIIR